MRKHILIIVFISLSISALQAQINKEVEVTKAFIPEIQQAVKPQLKATIADTTTINPDVDYNITPLSINTTLKSKAINPAKVTYWEYNRPASAQVKIGAGYPLNSLFQGVVSSHNASVGYIAAQVDHTGIYSDITSYNTLTEQNATQILNDASVSAGLYTGNNKLLAADFSYLYNYYQNYAFEQVASSQIGYQGLGATVRFGDDFVDLSRLNYAVRASTESYFDRDMYSTNSLDFGVDFSKTYGLGDMMYGIDYKRIDEGESYLVNDYSIYADLSTKLLALDINIGLDYHLYYSASGTTSEPSHYILPDVKIKYIQSAVFSAYLRFGGSIENNSFKELSTINQFVGSGMSYLAPTYDNYCAAGVMGELFKSALSYSLYVDYTIRENNRYWVLNLVQLNTNQMHNSHFDVLLDDIEILSVNAEIGYKPLSNLKFTLDAHYNSYTESQAVAGYNMLPKFTVGANAEYSARRFRLGVDARYIGEREGIINTYTTSSSAVYGTRSSVKLPGAINLSAYADYKLKDAFSIFVQGSNLCNENLYEWAMYRGFGVQVTAGVKFNFR